MPKTLLVVDDSATMRKVFELTFAGEDVRVVTHDGSDSLLGRARDEKPSAVIVDVGLGQGKGYEICRTLKHDAVLGNVAVLMLYSEQNPIDESRARDAGADGSILKPFDTQATIDKLKPYVHTSTGASVVAQAPGLGVSPGPSPQRSTGQTLVGGSAPPAPSPARPASAGFGSVGSSVPGVSAGKATQMFAPGAVPGLGVPPAPASAPRPAPSPPVTQDADIELEVDGDDEILSASPTPAPSPAVRPATAPHPVAPPPAAAPSSPIAAAVSAEVNQRAQGLGLSAAQVEAVTALTREVVERVVWEVVPQLAETMIREEIRRLTTD